MTSICLSTSFVSLLRRLFNALSVFSISQHYVMAKKATVAFNADGVPQPVQEGPKSLSAGPGEDVGCGGVDGECVGNSDANGALPRTSDNPEKTQTQTRENKNNNDKQKETAKHNPQLFDSARAPRYPIVLCHGLYGFDVRGPESFPKLRMHYWSNVMSILKKVGAEVVVTGVPGTASISSRAERMDQFLQERVKGRDVNFVAHSMGGLDCRHLITHIRPTGYRSLSLTSLSVPHRGSPFMDWCMANIGIGSPRPFPFPSSTTLQHIPPTGTSHKPKRPIPYSLSSPLLSRPHPSNDTQPSSDTFPSTTPPIASTIPSPDSGSPTSASASKLSARLNILQSLPSLPSSFTSLILSLIDSPAYSNLTTSFLRDSFNPYTPDDPSVKYFSIAARTHKMSIWHPLWIPKMIVDAAEELESREEEALASQMEGQGQGHEMTLSHPHLSAFHAPKASSADTIRTTLKGNDGLVPISSAKWGTFLGVVEGCNHWDIRGTGGFGSVPGGEGDDSGNGNGNGNGDKGGGIGIGLNRVGLDFDWEEGWKMWRDWVGAVSGSGSGENKTGNAAVAMEKTEAQSSALSALSATSIGGSSSSDSLTFSGQSTKLSGSGLSKSGSSWAALNGFSEGHRFDLERFYVALCRKLYDEGL